MCSVFLNWTVWIQFMVFGNWIFPILLLLLLYLSLPNDLCLVFSGTQFEEEYWPVFRLCVGGEWGSLPPEWKFSFAPFHLFMHTFVLASCIIYFLDMWLFICSLKFICSIGFMSMQEKQKGKIKEKFDKCVKEKLVDFCDVLNIPINKAVVKKVCSIEGKTRVIDIFLPL